jgi:hypothetical protein
MQSTPQILQERERERENKRGGESIQFILVTAKYILV